MPGFLEDLTILEQTTSVGGTGWHNDRIVRAHRSRDEDLSLVIN